MLKGRKSLTISIRRFKKVVGLEKAPKFNDKSVWINVQDFKGEYQRIRAYHGESLFDELKENLVPVGGFCGSSPDWNLRENPIEQNPTEPNCKMCLVEIGEEWLKKMKVTDLERFSIEDEKGLPFNLKNSRLACCITVEPWMNEMFIKIPILLPEDDKSLTQEDMEFS